MRIGQSTALIIVSFLLLAMQASAKAAETSAMTVLHGTTIRVAIADENYWPFHETNTQGKTEGFDVDIATALCAKMEVKCVFVAVSWGDTIPHLLKKKYDLLVTAMTSTAERRKLVDFTNPYTGDPWILLAKKGASFPITKDGLTGRTIGVQRTCPTWDGKAADFLHRKFGKTVTVKTYDMYPKCPSSGVLEADDEYDQNYRATYDRMFADLDGGRIDLLFDAKLSLHWSGAVDNGSRAFIGPDFFDYSEGCSIAVRKREPKLLNALNAALAAIHADGTYKTIMTRYFPFNIYGSE